MFYIRINFVVQIIYDYTVNDYDLSITLLNMQFYLKIVISFYDYYDHTQLCVKLCVIIVIIFIPHTRRYTTTLKIQGLS